MTIALLDGDVIACKAAFRAQKKYWVIQYDGKDYDFLTTSKTEALRKFKKEIPKAKDEDITWTSFVETEPVENAFHSAKLMLNKTLEAVGAVDYQNYITSSDKSNFRFDMATIWPYKGNRNPEDKPALLPDVREYLKERWQAEEVTGMEADDKLMIEHHKDIENTIICTVDKDLKNAAKWFYDIVKGQAYHFTPRDNKVHFWTQVLRGDSCDNIPGLRHFMKPRTVGPKKVEKLFKYMGEEDRAYYNAVKTVYYEHRKEGSPAQQIDFEEMVTEIGNLLWIRRFEEDKWEIPR